MDTNLNSQTNGSGVLNVILHGAFAFLRKHDPERIEALIPSMPHHVFRAGNWLGETELRGQGVVYELLGVKPGDDTFDPALNLLVKTNALPDIPHRTLIFPVPKRIASLRVADVPLDSFRNKQDLADKNAALAVQHVATLQVFSYDFEDENKLFLKASHGDGHYWEPVFTGNFINLHIFSAEDHFARLSNSEEDFNRCVALLGSQLLLDTRLVPSGILGPDKLPPGVTIPETEGLAARTQRMARLGRLVSEKGDTNLAWYGNDALDGDPTGCGGPCGN
uniref:Uncharacterized protein n=1 Tax=Solibacter usitatus (strain Ellin6076) TaxID=234267 RepID=Q02DA0_SOLUE